MRKLLGKLASKYNKFWDRLEGIESEPRTRAPHEIEILEYDAGETVIGGDGSGGRKPVWKEPEDEARALTERLWPHVIHEEPIAKGDWLDWDPVRG